MSRFSESIVEDAALSWLQGLGYAVKHGSGIAVGEAFAKRSDPNYLDAVLVGRLRRALVRLKPGLSRRRAGRQLPQADVRRCGFGAGAEARRPLGLAVVGGILVSQSLTLFITPVIYTYMESLQEKLGHWLWFLGGREKHAEAPAPMPAS
jgi:hypothetical protein